ncbi:hypothetical protein MPF19_11695 [Polaribacter sp. Z014]|uniref:hypothetical protein n=1 Tax=Polaribacter sp. Z014 TaxID=2927126 RepID=UPI0020200ACB|nr:hypothetical protein [Polaribacter sp. Z014]MCL7764083.1 hypothetical protein [Polaribacter sp. Z014]
MVKDIGMCKIILYSVLIGILFLFVGCGVSNTNAKKGFVKYLKEHHNNKYEILTFKRNFNAANMNPNLYWVELMLKENSKIVINFEWNAKDKALYVPFNYTEDRSIEALTNYQKQEIVLREELYNVLDKDVLSMDVNVFNHAISIDLGTEPTFDKFQYFSNKICTVLDKYPNTWTREAHVEFKIKREEKGFYELIVKPTMFNDSTELYRYKQNAIVANNYGSVKAENIDYIIRKEFSKPKSPIFLSNIWVNQKDLNSFYIAFEKHEPRKIQERNKYLTEGVGMYLIEMSYPNLKKKTLTYFDYKTTDRDDIFLFLSTQLPQDYQYLIADL